VVGFIFVAELVAVGIAWVIRPSVPQSIPSPIPTTVTNTEALGRVLYTDYVYYFQAAGIVLLIAMIGAIVLTLRHKQGVKRQNISAQVARTTEASIEIRKVSPGQGL
jgi:NADH-quinone oxidoreductase subunit J